MSASTTEKASFVGASILVGGIGGLIAGALYAVVVVVINSGAGILPIFLLIYGLGTGGMVGAIAGLCSSTAGAISMSKFSVRQSYLAAAAGGLISIAVTYIVFALPTLASTSVQTSLGLIASWAVFGLAGVVLLVLRFRKFRMRAAVS